MEPSSVNGWHVFYKTLIVVATLLGIYLLWALREIVIVVFVAIIFASAIRPYVGRLTRYGVPAPVAILLIDLLCLGGLAALLVFSIPPLARLTLDLMNGDLLIYRVQELMRDMLLFGWRTFRVILPVMEVPEQLRTALAEVNDQAREQAVSMARLTALGLGQIFLALIISFYWLTTREQFLNLFLLLSPARYRARANTIWTDIEQTLGAYLRTQMILMLIVGGTAYVGLLLLRVPYATALAVLAGLTEAIPLLGPVLGAVPAILVALTVSPTTALLTAALYVLIQLLEANLVVPKLMESNIGLNPLVVIVAIIAGGMLNGVVGALLAIPVAGALQVIAQHLLIEPARTRNQYQRAEGGVLLEKSGSEPPAVAGAVPSGASTPAD